MKEKTKFILALAIVSIMLMMAILPMMMATEKNKGTIPAEIQSGVTRTITRTVLDVPMSNWDEVNSTIFKGTYLTSKPNYWAQNLSVSYDALRNSANLSATRNRTGCFIISGFESGLRTTIKLDMKTLSYGFNGLGFAIKTYEFTVGLTCYNSYYKYEITWYNETSVVKSWIVNSQIWGAGALPYIRLQLDWYENRTFHFSFTDLRNGDIEFQGWNKTRQDTSASATSRQLYVRDQPEINPNYIFFEVTPGTSSSYNTWYSIYLRNLTQTINVTQSDVYADIPTTKYVGWGFDGIYPTIYQNATNALYAHDAKTTMFFDNGSYGVGNWNQTQLADLISHKQEVGIHYTYYSVYNASTLILFENEYDNLSALFLANGWVNQSIAWTSYGNGHDGRYTDYMWNNFSSISRQIWAHPWTNQGGLTSSSQTHDFGNLTKNMTLRGQPYVGYCHRVSGPLEDISIRNWSYWVNATYNNSLEIVGYLEWWSRYCAPWYVSGSITTVNDYTRTFIFSYANLNLKNKVEIRVNVSAAGVLTGETLVLSDSNGVIPSTNYVLSGDFMILNATEGETYTLTLSDRVPETKNPDSTDDDDSIIIAGDDNWNLFLIGGGALLVLFLVAVVVVKGGKRSPQGGMKS